MIQKNNRSSYKKITQDVRRQIIRRFQAQESLKDISKNVGLNVSTCKGIIKVYQEEGRIGKKLKRNRPIRVVQTFSCFEIIEGQKKRIDSPKFQEKKMFIQNTQNVNQFLLKQSKTRADQYLEQCLQQQRKQTEEKVLLQENQMQFIPYQNYLNFFSGMTWYMPFQ